MEKAVAVVIAGRVQGVGFRAATQSKAAALGLTGWVRNRKDGAVEAFAQGTSVSVEAFLAWCTQGPRLAVVKAAESKEVPVDKALISFVIRRE